MHGGSAETQSEELGHSTPEPHSETGSRALDRRERGDEGSGAQRLSETAPERGTSGGRDDEDAHDLIHSRRSRGEYWCFGLDHGPY